jgi:hypothetical protein
MPPKVCWETFFNPSWILKTAGLHEAKSAIVDVGAGCGTFALAAAGLTRQQVIAIDIEQPLLDALTRKAKADDLDIEKPTLRDVMMDGTGLPWMCIPISCCCLELRPFRQLLHSMSRIRIGDFSIKFQCGGIENIIFGNTLSIMGLAETRSPTLKTCCLRFLTKSAVRCPEFAYQTAASQKDCNYNSLILLESVII